MKLVLLSGGSGKRLWPLSNNQRSKQFIRAFKNPDTGGLESMVQRVWRQLAEAGMQDSAYIATGEGQKALIKKQLGIETDRIIVEPSRRDTYPALLLAASYLHTIGMIDDELMIVCPVDPYVDVSFFEKLTELEKLLNSTEASLGLVGILPTFPSEKYGYIVPEKAGSSRVQRFQEKPSTKVATELIAQCAVWNAGVFGVNIGTLLDEIKKFGLPVKFDELVKAYDKLPKSSFDYEFSEKQKNISYLVYDGFWKDLGTWNTLTEEADTESIGSNAIQIDCEDTLIVNEIDIPVAVIGGKDLIIAAGPEGILVSTKQESPRVKEIPEGFFETVHYVEEEWGIRKTLYHSDKAHASSYEVLNDKSVTLTLAENQSIYRLSGKGIIFYRGKEVTLQGIDEFIFMVVTEEREK